MDWPEPSPAAAALIRTGTRRLLDDPGELVEALDRAILAVAGDWLEDDPTLAAEAAASNRANFVHWATCTLEDPGGRVPVDLTPPVLAIARDTVRRGADQVVLRTYHAGQNVAWQYFLDLAFELSDDPAVLKEALDAVGRSIFTYVDDTVAALDEQMERERAELTRSTNAERFSVVSMILEGAPLASDRASARLGYDLRRRHVAAIVWSDPGAADHGQLGAAVDTLGRLLEARRPLTVIASASSTWVWLTTDADIDARELSAAIDAIPNVRVAVGPPGAGIEGFRRSHHDAVLTQRLMFNMPGDVRVATFADVEVVALATQDLERASTFVAGVLGDLASAPAELRETVRVYLREQSSASRAARALYAHRNTVLNRMQRAEELLPLPIEGNGLELALALEIVHWLGPLGEPSA